MVFIESRKYACETCIKGHRSSACKHTDRPLFEIKKKGRPVTQCEHCRELRKTKQVHVKCICEIKSDVRKVAPKAPDSAAFPNGLPHGLALEASVAHAEPTTPGSGGASPSCCCVAGEQCQCWTPRKSAPRPRRKTEPAPAPMSSTPPAAEDTPGSQILARISELRPVLPRPSPHHEPSSGVAHGRHHHEGAFFSPYGRAYDINHPHHLPHTPADRPPKIAAAAPPPPPPVTFPSPCGCGDGCSCPGCYHHNNAPFAPSPTAYPTCQNPSSCHACLDCTILSLPPDTALSIPEQQQAEVIDEWIRQMSNNGDWNDAPPATRREQQPCATCTSLFCTGNCDRETSSSPVHHQASCCDKPRVGSTPPTTMASSDFFDYTMLGTMQPPYRSRSPSVSPHPMQADHQESAFSSQLFGSGAGTAAFPAYSSPDLVDKMSAPQQSMYINGRGFYSDPYLSGGGSGSDVQHSGLTPFLPPPPMLSMDFDYEYVYQGLDDMSAALATATTATISNNNAVGGEGERVYAVSNPDSDTSSSFDSSVDEHYSTVAVTSFVGDGMNKLNEHALSVSPVSFEDMRTLY